MGAGVEEAYRPGESELGISAILCDEGYYGDWLLAVGRSGEERIPTPSWSLSYAAHVLCAAGRQSTTMGRGNGYDEVATISEFRDQVEARLSGVRWPRCGSLGVLN